MNRTAHVIWLWPLFASVAVLAGSAPLETPPNLVDREIEARLGGATVAPPCTETEFLRRVTLDLAGVVPDLEEARAHLAKPDRDALINRLIEGPEFDAWWARFLLEATTGRRAADYDGFEGAFLYRWYRKQLQVRRPYDQMVRDMLTGAGNAEDSPQANFLLINNVTPSDAAGRIGSAFLGTTLNCAQCHDHPFDTYTQKDFWGVAAFLSGARMFVNEPNTNNEVRGVENAPPGQDGNPEKPAVSVPPRWIGAATAAPRGTRDELADFVTGDPLFAKNFVNRVWARLMGQGLVEPLTGFGAKARPTHPELLEGLARGFTESGYDIRALVRTILSSEAYQRSSKPSTTESHPYAQAAIRPLTCDQLYRSILKATGYSYTTPVEDWGNAKVRMNRLSYDDLTPPQIFGKYPLTLRREVVLLNDPEVHTAVKRGVKSLLQKQGKTVTPAHFETIFMTLLSRPPTPAEQALLPSNPEKADLEDVFWSVINSLEFQNNH